ncbi:N-6 DNA methylase [Photobacterium leiognathi]|uniref:N-6 DNA methylase n=1 Tax=Photobacterium leiognathi TaxID=553611 RepID=UPI0029813FE8|nr:N-6 DNA methylase [Photobacterium leiognathi]
MNKGYKKAFKLIESWRYKYNVEETLRLFIADWSHKHTKMYPVTNDIVNEQAYLDVAIPLSHVLSELMLDDGETDPLAVLLGEFGKSNNAFRAYYPTPDSVSTLISSLLGSECKSIYEPCAGTGSIIINKVEKLFLENIEKSSPLSNFTFHAEDVDEVACYGLLIQLVHKLRYLELHYGKPAAPRQFTIQQVNVLTRQKGKVYFELLSKN